MADLTLTTFDWVPPPPRGFVRDLRVRWALEEAALPYRVASAPFDGRGAEHLAHQPFGQVPWLTDGDLSIFESGAILLHLGGLSAKLMPTDPRGRNEATEWLFAALNSVEMASLDDVEVHGSSERYGRVEIRRRLPKTPPQAHGGGAGQPRMAGRHVLRRRHPDVRRAAHRRSVRRARGQSRLPQLRRARHRPPGFRQGPRRPDGAFRCGGRDPLTPRRREV